MVRAGARVYSPYCPSLFIPSCCLFIPLVSSANPATVCTLEVRWFIIDRSSLYYSITTWILYHYIDVVSVSLSILPFFLYHQSKSPFFTCCHAKQLQICAPPRLSFCIYLCMYYNLFIIRRVKLQIILWKCKKSVMCLFSVLETTNHPYFSLLNLPFRPHPSLFLFMQWWLPFVVI